MGLERLQTYIDFHQASEAHFSMCDPKSFALPGYILSDSVGCFWLHLFTFPNAHITGVGPKNSPIVSSHVLHHYPTVVLGRCYDDPKRVCGLKNVAILVSIDIVEFRSIPFESVTAGIAFQAACLFLGKLNFSLLFCVEMVLYLVQSFIGSRRKPFCRPSGKC